MTDADGGDDVVHVGDVNDTAEPLSDADRLRRLRRLLLIGLGVGVLLVPAAGLAGATGQAGVAILFLTWAVTCASGALYGSITLLRDDYAHRKVSRTRILTTVVLYAFAAMFAAMVAAVGG